MPHLKFRGVKVHYRETGSGTPVVLLHAGNISGAQWRKIVEILADRYRMISIDQYGHGGSDPWPGELEARTHEAEAELVRAVMSQFSDPVHLVGHSYGGAIALRLVIDDITGVCSLCLIEPMALSVLKLAGEQDLYQEGYDLTQNFLSKVMQGRVEEAWKTFIDSTNSPGTWESYSEEVKSKCFATTDNVISGFNANLKHATTFEECGAIALPSLVIRGETTVPHLGRMAEVIADKIPGCGLKIISGAGHMSPITHPEAVAKELVGHFQNTRII